MKRKLSGAAIGSAAAIAALAAVSGGAVWAYNFAFRPKKDRSREARIIPPGRQYQSYKDAILANIDKVEAAPFVRLTMTSRDGLTLSARYYQAEDREPAVGEPATAVTPGEQAAEAATSAAGEQIVSAVASVAPGEQIDATGASAASEQTVSDAAGASAAGVQTAGAAARPLVLLFHGYRSAASRDACGGFQLFRALGYDMLLIDQRAHGESQGRAITLGARERYDCVDWCRYCVRQFGADRPLLLVGLSMGAATVLMASGLALPPSVRGIIADCGYTSAEDILKETMKKMKMPVKLAWPFLRMTARLFGGFDPKDGDAQKALARCRVPVLLIHGQSDTFVPWEMSRKNYDACTAQKEVLYVPEAGHGMSYYVDTPRYTKAVEEFCARVLG